jgi:hypothetical protein
MLPRSGSAMIVYSVHMSGTYLWGRFIGSLDGRLVVLLIVGLKME